MRKKKVEKTFKASRLPSVTNSRGSQKLIPVPVSRQLEQDIIKAMTAGGYTNRSDFIRDAIREKAATVGVVIPAQLGRGPMRVEYPPHQEEVSVIEDKALDAALKKQEILGAGQLGAKAAVTKLGLKPKAASTTGKKAAPARPAPRASSGQQSPPRPAPTAPVS